MFVMLCIKISVFRHCWFTFGEYLNTSAITLRGKLDYKLYLVSDCIANGCALLKFGINLLCLLQ